MNKGLRILSDRLPLKALGHSTKLWLAFAMKNGVGKLGTKRMILMAMSSSRSPALTQLVATTKRKRTRCENIGHLLSEYRTHITAARLTWTAMTLTSRSFEGK